MGLGRFARRDAPEGLRPAIANHAWFEVDLRETSMMVTMVKMPECIDEMVDTYLELKEGSGTWY